MTAQPAQCGRTFIHLPHETDTGSGQCPGLDGTEVARGAQCVEPGCEDDHATDLRSRIRHALDWSPVDHIVTKAPVEELTDHLMRHLAPTEVPQPDPIDVDSGTCDHPDWRLIISDGTGAVIAGWDTTGVYHQWGEGHAVVDALMDVLAIRHG